MAKKNRADADKKRAKKKHQKQKKREQAVRATERPVELLESSSLVPQVFDEHVEQDDDFDDDSDDDLDDDFDDDDLEDQRPYDRYLELLEAEEEGTQDDGPLPTDVEEMTTEEIVGKIEALGIHTDEASFREAVGSRRSAWHFAQEEWWPRLAVHCPPEDEDFVALAACTLGARWRSESPFREELVRRLHQTRRSPSETEAIGEWCEMWRRLKLFVPDECRSPEGISRWLSVEEDFYRVIEQLDDLVDDPDDARQPELERLLVTIQDVVARLDSDPCAWWAVGLRCVKGRLLIRLGRRDEAKVVLRAVLADYPGSARPYLDLAMALDPPKSDASVVLEALALVDEALRVTDDAVRCGCHDLADAYRKRLRELGVEPPPAPVVKNSAPF